MKISHPRVWLGLGCIAGLLGLAVPSAQAQNLADTIAKIKPSIVAIGTFQKTRRPPSIFRGTGFIVADGLHVVTNAHVFQEKIDTEKKETLTIFSGKSDRIEIREATKRVTPQGLAAPVLANEREQSRGEDESENRQPDDRFGRGRPVRDAAWLITTFSPRHV
jgi:hypothetical protein